MAPPDSVPASRLAAADCVAAGPALLAPLAAGGMVRLGPALAVSPARARAMAAALTQAADKAAAQGPTADPLLALACAGWAEIQGGGAANGVRASTILRLWRSTRSTGAVLSELQALGVSPALVGLAIETGAEDEA